MKNKSILTLTLSLLLLQLVSFTSIAQVKYSSKDYSNLVVSGTSTMHDWDMKSANGICDATFTFSGDGKITGLSNLSFVTNVAELKSGKGAMDKNAYKALKKDKFATIKYTAASGTVSTTDGVNYSVKSIGKLTIAGSTHDVQLISSLKLNADKSITVAGSQAIKMKDYGVEPPSFMFGAVKTGNDITIKFNLTLKK